MKSVAVVAESGRGGEILSDFADNTDAERSRRLRAVPRHMRAIASLVGHAQYPSVRRRRRSDRAIITLAIICVISALVAAYRSWHQEAPDRSPRPALGGPTRA